MTDGTDSEAIKPVLWGIARPTAAWTLHFIFVYAALSAACGERAVFTNGTVLVAVGIATVLALVIAGWSLFQRSETEFHIAARWTTIISLVAIVFSASPVLLMSGCG
jgi:uncharacterized membrane protein